MRKSKDQVVRIDSSCWTGNFWVDTGIVVLLEGLGAGDHRVDDIREWLLRKLVQRTGNKGKYYDETRNELREYQRESWVYPTSLFIRVSGKVKKVRINGKEYPTGPPKFELQLDLTKQCWVCDMCGETAPVTDAKMWMFPFIVDPKKFGTFYSGGKRGLRLCARCALAGLAGYFGWLWKAQGRDAFHFFIFHSDLQEMKRFHREVLQPLRIEADKGGNFRPAFSGKYIHETTLGLLLALFAHVRQSDRLSAQGRRYLAALLGATGVQSTPRPITLYAVTGEPRRGFNMKGVREFTKLQSLYRLYERWLKVIARAGAEPNPHRRIVGIFRQFEAQQGGKRDSLWRDKIAWAVLEFDDPLPYVQDFLFEVRAREQDVRPLVSGTLDVFDQYVQEVLGMDEEFRRMLAGFGHALGKAAQAHNEAGLLYGLRNAKNPEDFYRVLNDAQFRLEVAIPEALLRIEKGERIAGVSWLRVKTHLAIYAMNTYLHARKRAVQAEGQEKEEDEP